MQKTWVRSLGREDPLQKRMATHSTIVAWRIPWTEKPGGLQSTGLQRVRHNWVTNSFTFHCELHYPTPQMWGVIITQQADAGKITVLVSNRIVSSLLSNLLPHLVPSSHLPLLILYLLLDWEKKTFTPSALQIYLRLCRCPFFPSFGSWANSFLSYQRRSFQCFLDLTPAWEVIPSQVVCASVFPSFIFNFPFPHFLNGKRNGNPLQYSCLENPMDKGTWWATVHGVAESWTRLSDTHTFLKNKQRLWIFHLLISQHLSI